MATDSTNLPQGELNNDASNDMAGSELEFGAVQLAQVTTDGGQPVQLPQGQQTVLIPVQPGQTLTLPTDSPDGLLAKIGPEGNLAIVVDGRTIIFQGYVQANDQSPVRVVTNDGDQIDVADVVAATDESLDIQTAAGPATGNTGDSTGSGIYTPFNFGPALGGLNAIGVLDPTALGYKLIDDERETFVRDEDTGPTGIDITFDILGGVVNEDDLFADPARIPDQFQAFKLVVQDQGNDGTGNDPFDDDGGNDKAGATSGDGYPDPDREPLLTIATVTVGFGPDVPGTLKVDDTVLPTGLTSEGEPIIYEVLPPSGLQGNGIVGFVDADFDGKYTDGVDRIVFDVKVQEKSSDSVFHVAFTLYDNIDNEAPDADNDGKADLLGANEQIVDLPVKLTATDSDGTPMSTVMKLGVEDDVPFFGQVHYSEGEGGISVTIDQTDANIVHDETKGPDDGSDDHWPSEAQPAVSDATDKVINAGFGLPYGDSEGSLYPKGVAQTQVIASFGADQQSQELSKGADGRDSIFGALADRADGTIDGLVNGVDPSENERPFELFMIVGAGAPGATETSFKTPGNNALQTVNLSIQDQLTNATVTWDGGEVLQVWVHQVDAQTIIGYVVPEGGSQEEALARALEQEGGENGEAVFVLTIDDNGVLTFVQYHQLNHPDSPDSHDEAFSIKAADGSDLINVRISDNDGDHAHQPVNLVVEDDGPKFKDVCFTHGNGTVDEDYLGGPLNPGNYDLDNLLGGGKGDDQILDGTSTSGTINFSIGSDKPGTLSIGSLVITDSAGNVVDITALKTADGNGVDIVKSGPDANGVITWTGIEQGSGDPVFTMKLDTSGNDMGDFKFTLNQALQHPFTDSDLNNDDNPDSAFEDNFNFAFNVIATDIDKDTAQGTINIRVDDDSPTALDDHDSVTEGKTGGNLNFASGNVVTGGDASFLGKDGNVTFPLFLQFNDGTPDLPGADRPYTISKLAHDGNTYELSADGQSVTGLTDGDSYNPANGVLTITTEEGGTFEIVMTSSNQSLVGEYRYTVPEDAVHKDGQRGGPASEAASMSGAFDTVGEWQSSFAAAGITLIPSGGSLGLRDLSISGPDYRGIGVNSGNGDNSEVDNAGPNETLALQIATPTDNATLTIGALYNGSPDAGFQEILLWQVYDGATLVASGQILGTTTGLVTLDIDTNGDFFDKIVLTPINNGAGDNGNNSDFVLVNAKICDPEDKFTEQFDYTLRDSDGDEDTASICIDVKDTEPKVRGDNDEVKILVDEDGLPGGIKDAASKDDNESTSGGNVDNDAAHKGKITFTAGADPVKIELNVDNGGDTGLVTSTGEKRVLAAWDAASSTLIGYIEGTDPSDAANRVFLVTITNHQTGEFTFTLLKPVEHPDSDPQNPNADENHPNLSFEIDFTIEDKDCDVATGVIKVSIDDDMPVITQQSGSGFFLITDESLDGDSKTNNAGDHPHDPGDRIEDDEDGANLPSALNNIANAPGVDVIGAAKANGAAFFTYQPGADGLQSAVYSLTIGGGGNGPVPTNLVDTLTGQAISLVSGFADGTVRGVTAGGQIVFAFTINGTTGEVSMAQYRAINHGAEEPGMGNHDEEKTLGGSSASSTVPPLTNLLSVTLTVTDKDNDAVYKSVDITGKVKFEDDGPKADFDIRHDVKIRIDESVGTDPSDSNAADENNSADPTDIGYAKVAANVLFDDDSEFGTDGEAATDARQYKLLVNGSANSGLDDTETNSDVLLTSNPDGTLIEGRSAVGGHLVFTIAINPDTGEVTVTQYRAVEHDNENDHDDYEVMSGNKVLVELTVTDGDGDKDTDTADLGSRIKFEDDGPKTDLQTVCGAQIVLDESTGPAAADGYPDPNSNDEAGNVSNDIAYAKVAGASLFFDVTDFGSDKEAASNAKTYDFDYDDNSWTGLTDTATGDPIYLDRVSDTEVLGRVSTTGSDPIAFRITINPTTGEVTISQFRAVAHDNDGSSASDHDEASSPEIMDAGKLFVRLTVEDGDGDTASDKIDLGKLIKFEDDGPVTVADLDSVKEDSGDYAIGNVITGANLTSFGSDANGTDGSADDAGSDGLAAIKWKDGGGFDGNGNIVGLYGTLYVDANGGYKYVLDDSNSQVNALNDGQTLQDVFNYVIYDKDGDSSPSTLTITIDGRTDAFRPTAENATAFVDEDGLPAGLKDSQPGDDNADAAPDTVAGEAVFHDLTLPVNWNGDVGTIALSAGNWTGIKTIDGHDLAVGAGSTSTLLKIVDATTSELVLEVEIKDHTTGEYEVRLHKALSHPDSNNSSADDATDFGNGSYEDNITVPVTVTYTNIVGSTPAVININVDDDSPVITSTSFSGGLDTLDDEGATQSFASGIEGSVVPGNDTPGAPNFAMFFVNANGGADGIKGYEFDLTTIAANNTFRATDGTADGAPIAYTIEGDNLVARISEVGNPLNGREVLRVDPNGGGSFIVTQNSPLFHSGQDEVNDLQFKVTVKVVDNDGDAVATTVTVKLDDDMPSVTVNTQIPALVLDETRPVGTETDGDSDPAGKQTVTVDFSGNFTAAFGADGAADTGAKVYALELSGTDVPSGLYALTPDGTGQGTQIVLNQSGNTITGTANGQTYFTIEVNPADGKVTFTQSQNVWHANTGNDDDTSSLHTAAADALKLTLTIKDGDNDTDSDSINLGHDVFQIEDDGPSAVDDNVVAAPDTGGTADILFIVDVSGSMTGSGSSVPNVPGFDDNRLGLARYSMQQLLLNHPEILNVKFVKFDNDVNSPTSVWLSRADALAYILNDGNFVGGGNTNYDLALGEAIAKYNDSTRPEGQADQTLVYFLSDGAPNDGNGINEEGINPGNNPGVISRQEWEQFVSDPANDISNVFAIGIGSGVNAGNLAPISYPNVDNQAPAGEDNIVLVPDADIAALTQTLDDLMGSVLTPVNGNVTDNDSFGTDGGANPELVSVTYGATYVFDPAHTSYTIDLGAGRGSLKINNDGSYTYTPPSTADGPIDANPFELQYTIRDRDGDTSTAKIIIDLAAPPATDLNGVADGDDVTVGFVEQTAKQIAPDATIAADVANLESMTVTLINRPNGNAAESLSVPGVLPGGLTAVYTAATGILLITGTASAATYQSVLQSIVYNNTSDVPNTTPRDVTVVVNDGASNSAANHVTINVTPVNDSPDANITAPSYNAIEQTPLNLHGTGLSISDVDAGGGNVTVTLSVGAGTLVVIAGNSGVGAGNITGSGTSSVTITGTVTQINNLLGGIDTGMGSAGTIVFNPSGGDNPPASTQLTLHVNDNGNTGGGGGQTDSAIVTINITNTLEAPVPGTDRIYTNVSGLITVQDSLLLKNDTDVDTAHASLVVLSATAGGNSNYFDTQPSHAGTSVTFELDTDGGSSFSNGTTKAFTYVVGDPTETGTGTVNVTYDVNGSVNGSNDDDILIGLNVGLNGRGGADHMIGTGTADLLDYSDISSNWNLTLGAGGSGNANIDGADTYEGIDGIMGGSGDNTLTGNELANILNGGGGEDTLDGGNDAVADILNGGSGDDTLIWRGSADTYNGDSGVDTLDVSGTASVDFTTVADGVINSVERVSMTGGVANTVTLNAADVISDFETSSFDPSGSGYSSQQMLTISGDNNDTVNLTGGGWFAAAGAGGFTPGYTLYSHVTAGSNPASNEDAYVLVQNGVHVNLS